MPYKAWHLAAANNNLTENCHQYIVTLHILNIFMKLCNKPTLQILARFMIKKLKNSL